MSRSDDNGWGCVGCLFLVIAIFLGVKGCNVVVDKISYAINEGTIEEQTKIVLDFEKKYLKLTQI